MAFYDIFTLTEIDTDEMGITSNENLWLGLSRCSMNTSSKSVLTWESVSVSASVNTLFNGL